MTASPVKKKNSALPASGAVVARLRADAPAAKRLAERLSEAFEDAAISIVEDNESWTLEAVFPDEPDRRSVYDLIAAAAGPDAARDLSFEILATRDWVRASLEGLRPVRAGRFFVHGAHDRDRVPLNRIGVEIEAGLAFGTGHHGTTRGCLLALDRIAKARRPSRVLDVGTGSGVLAIAAAQAFRVPVIATDIDPAAVSTAHDNVVRNRAGAMVRTYLAERGRKAVARNSPYGLVLANILAMPLMRLSAALSRRLAPGGRIVLSGLLPTHAMGVIAAYRAQGLALDRVLRLEGWVTLVMRRGTRRRRHNSKR